MEQPKLNANYIHAMSAFFTWASKELKRIHNVCSFCALVAPSDWDEDTKCCAKCKSHRKATASDSGAA